MLNSHLAPGVRELPSQINIELLQAILDETTITQNAPLDQGGAEGEGITAALSSDPLLAAIVNGDFSLTDPNNDNFGWQTRGAATVLNEQALLTEESPFLSNITQTFTIPESAQTLQFTLTEYRFRPRI